SKNVPVVITTRTGSGRIASAGGGRIAGQDLAPIKARLLLMLALTRTSETAELRRIFEEYCDDEAKAGCRGRRSGRRDVGRMRRDALVCPAAGARRSHRRPFARLRH